MCAISALSPQRFRGYGPGDPDKVYTVLIATRHDTLMSVASQGIRPIPSSTLEPNKGEELRYASNSANDAILDKVKDIHGYPSMLNERVPPLSQFSGLKALYSASADYVKCEVAVPASLYGAERLKVLIAEKRNSKRSKSRYLEPAGIRHVKKKIKRNADDGDYHD